MPPRLGKTVDHAPPRDDGALFQQDQWPIARSNFAKGGLGMFFYPIDITSRLCGRLCPITVATAFPVAQGANHRPLAGIHTYLQHSRPKAQRHDYNASLRFAATFSLWGSFFLGTDGTKVHLACVYASVASLCSFPLLPPNIHSKETDDYVHSFAPPTSLLSGGPPFSKSGYDLDPLTPEEVESRVDKLTELQKVVLTQVRACLC